MTTFERALRTALDEIGIAASDSQIERLAAHHALLERWNRRMNLTRITGAVQVARRHFGEAAFVHRELPPAASMVDVGSGAGFPGLPVAVLRPESLVTLVESKRRKAAFLRQASWDLPNVRVAACRIADWTGTADWALLRAVAPSRVLPDLAGRAVRVAILGTDQPADALFGDWESRDVPWSTARRLWLGEAGR